MSFYIQGMSSKLPELRGKPSRTLLGKTNPPLINGVKQAHANTPPARRQL